MRTLKQYRSRIDGIEDGPLLGLCTEKGDDEMV